MAESLGDRMRRHGAVRMCQRHDEQAPLRDSGKSAHRCGDKAAASGKIATARVRRRPWRYQPSTALPLSGAPSGWVNQNTWFWPSGQPTPVLSSVTTPLALATSAR